MFKKVTSGETRSPLASKFLSPDRSAESDDEDQRGQGADADPDPFLLGQAGSLQLVEILRQLMQILGVELRQFLVDLLLRESVVRKDLRHLLIGSHITDERKIS